MGRLGWDVVGTTTAHIPLTRLGPGTTHYCKGDWEMKSSCVLCAKVPGKLLLPNNLPLIQLKSECDYLLAPGAHPALLQNSVPLNLGVCYCPTSWPQTCARVCWL